MTPKLKRTLIRTGAGAAFAVLLIWLMWGLQSVTTMTMVALFLAYLLNPIVQRLDARGVPRAAAAFLILLVGLALMAGFFLVIVPAILGEIGRFASHAPQYWNALQGWLVQAADRLNLEIPQDWNELTSLAIQRGKTMLPSLADSAVHLVASAFKSTLSLISALLYVIMVPVIAYYLLVSFEDMKASAKSLIPPYARETVVSKLIEMDRVLAAFVRGQLTVALILGIIYAVGFVMIGIDLALVLGILSGLLWIIPYVGTVFAAVAGSLMALVKFGDLTHVAYVVGWIALAQVVEAYMLTPRIVGHAIGLHPVVYILALMVGANLFGFVGMLVAIPVTAVLKVLLSSAVNAYRSSYLYREPAGEEAKT